MKRTAVILAVTLLTLSLTSLAFADDDVDDSAEAETEKELSDAQQMKVDLLADYFGAVEEGEEPEDGGPEELAEQITELRTGDTKLGWGAIYKLMLLAQAKDTTLGELLESDALDGDGWAFGRHFKALTDEERALLEDTPKNLGQLKKQAREHKNPKKGSSDD